MPHQLEIRRRPAGHAARRLDLIFRVPEPAGFEGRVFVLTSPAEMILLF
jgi:hypothetical protein